VQLQLRELLPLGQEQQLGQQLVLELQLGEQQLVLELGEEQRVRGAGEQLPGEQQLELELGEEQLVRGVGEQLLWEQLGEAGRRILFWASSQWVTI